MVARASSFASPFFAGAVELAFGFLLSKTPLSAFLAADCEDTMGFLGNADFAEVACDVRTVVDALPITGGGAAALSRSATAL